MRRGSVVVVAAQGDHGKPRPAVVVQSDVLNETHGTILVCPVTTYRQDAPLIWIDVEPLPENGLRRRSQIMADRIVTLRRDKFGKTIGQVETPTMTRLTKTLALILGITG